MEQSVRFLRFFAIFRLFSQFWKWQVVDKNIAKGSPWRYHNALYLRYWFQKGHMVLTMTFPYSDISNVGEFKMFPENMRSWWSQHNIALSKLRQISDIWNPIALTNAITSTWHSIDQSARKPTGLWNKFTFQVVRNASLMGVLYRPIYSRLRGKQWIPSSSACMFLGIRGVKYTLHHDKKGEETFNNPSSGWRSE